MEKKNLKKIDENTWEIPKEFRSDMRVPGRIFASEKILDDILEDESLEQVINVATLPGILGWSLAMPDIHEGYGAPVGSVFALDAEEGVISPGAVGYDINCGVRIIRTGVKYEEIKNSIPKLAEEFYRQIPSGVGRGGWLKLNRKDLDSILSRGVKQLAEWDYATEEDIVFCESNGCLSDADASAVSERAKKRGNDQVGTLGAGNHFVEIQKVDKIFYEQGAEKMGIYEGEVVIMVHCGSRGLGHQVATDYIQTMLRSLPKYDIKLSDKQLACAPFNSSEGQNYWRAMSASANFAWTNRQFITHLIRKSWEKVFKTKHQTSSNQLSLVYDVAHNIAKVENHKTDGGEKKVIVHRKGATRAFPAEHPEIPERYKSVGQPVLIPGSMGTFSYVLTGCPGAMEKSFGSSCHGAGRVMSRTKAKKTVRGIELKNELESRGISIFAGSMAGLAEEAPLAYKDVEEVVRVVDNAGLAKRVARMKPLGVIKG